MKILRVILVSGMAPMMFAATQPPFHFDAKIEVPALGILEGSKESLLSNRRYAPRFVTGMSKATPSPRPEPKLRIIAPNPETDYKLRISVPDESIDPKAVVDPMGAEPGR